MDSIVGCIHLAWRVRMSLTSSFFERFRASWGIRPRKLSGI